jgi:nucleoside-diphosphate-sugar epimerase
MRVLLTGATGYIGRRLTAECLKCSDTTHVIVRPISDLRPLPPMLGHDNIHVFDGSLDSLRRAIDDASPDLVVHLASLFLVQHSPGQVIPLVLSNVQFGTMLLEVMAEKKVTRFVNTGSFWQHYGEGGLPANLYAATKNAFAEVLRFYVDSTPLKAVTLELPDTYGPDDPRRKIITLLVDSVRRRSPIDLSPGEQILDLVHVDDVVDAFRTAMTAIEAAPTENAIYSITSASPRKLKDIVDLIASIAGSREPLRLGARPYRPREVMAPVPCGLVLPGWTPRRSLEDFLRQQLKGVDEGLTRAQ